MTAKTMAEVLAGHQDWTYQKNLGYYRSEYLCGCGETFWSGDHEEDPSFNQATAAHQAAVLSAAGFGLVADAGAILQATDLIRDLIDPDDCSFDHHGGCQAHGYLSLQPGEMCPQLEAKAWVHNQDAAAVRGEG